jgi:hypothetical protein
LRPHQHTAALFIDECTLFRYCRIKHGVAVTGADSVAVLAGLPCCCLLIGVCICARLLHPSCCFALLTLQKGHQQLSFRHVPQE